MKKIKLVIIVLLLGVFIKSNAQTATDTLGIETAIMNYIEGYYTADAARMEAGIYHDVAKRFVTPERNGRNYVQHMTSMKLVQISRDKKDDSIKNGPLKCNIKIFEIYGKVAIARAETTFFGFVDFFHLGFINGEWKIVNVIWDIKPKEK